MLLPFNEAGPCPAHLKTHPRPGMLRPLNQRLLEEKYRPSKSVCRLMARAKRLTAVCVPWKVKGALVYVALLV